MEWLQHLKSTSVQDIAGQLGLRSGRLRTLGPCPACSAEKRGGQDPRPPIGIAQDGRGWQCHACGAKGDAVELCCLVVCRRSTQEMATEDWQALKGWAEARHLISGDAPSTHARQSNGGRPRALSVGSLMGDKRDKTSQEPRRSVKRQDSGEQQGEELTAPAGRFSWTPTLPDECAAALWQDTPEAVRVRAYLMEHRKFPEEAIRYWRLGVYVQDGKPVVNDAGRPYLTIPHPDETGKIVNVKFRSVPVVGTCEYCSSPLGCRKCREYRAISTVYNRPMPLFGSHLLSPDKTKAVCVAEGELDVVALWVYGYRENVVSGTAGAKTFKEEWLDQLEDYQAIFGFFDCDDAGEEGWKEFVEKVGVYKCSRVRLPLKDAGDCLSEGVTQDVIIRAVGNAVPAHGLRFARVDSFVNDLEQLIENPDVLRGAPTGSKKLDEMLGGWRPGVIVVTGDTGSGKTTWGTWVLLEQARKGQPVLVTSFEQSPIGTVQKLLRMQVGRDFTAVTREEREDGMRLLGALPLYILDHYGHLPPEKLIDVLRYGKRRLGVRFFLVDHLGFLVSEEADDERRAIEAIVRALALVASQMGVTVFLVVHPRNDATGEAKRGYRVTMRHLKGASAIRQDAADVLVVEKELPDRAKGQKVKRPWPQARIYADKVRSEFGISGSDVALPFDPGSCTYADEWDQTPAGRNGWLVPRSMGETIGSDQTERPKSKRSLKKKAADEDDSQQQLPSEEPTGADPRSGDPGF